MSDSKPAWWNIIVKRMVDRIAGVTPSGTRRVPINDAVENIMNYIYERLDKQMQGSNDNIDIDLKTVENATAFLALLFIDICHDAGADNVIRNILNATDAKTGLQAFKVYITQVEFVHPGIKDDILKSVSKVAPLINNSVYINNGGKFVTDEHQAFCETGALMRRLFADTVFNVFNQDVFSLINSISDQDAGNRAGVFDQSSAGTVLQTMGLMKIRPIVAIPNVADQGLNIQLNPTIPTNFGYITEIFKNLVMKSPKEFSKIGRYTLGPSAYWMAQNDPNLGLGPEDAASYSTELPCSLIELLDLMRTPGQGNLNQEKLSMIVQYLFNEKDGLLKYLETIGFFNSKSCADSKALFENLKRSNGIMDNNDSWASTIRVGDKTILEVQYKGDVENKSIISTVTVFDTNGKTGVIKDSVKSARDAGRSPTITNTIFKTIGDNNMFLYAVANKAWAMTGDKVAASQYLLLSYLIEYGFADVYVNNVYVADVGAKFIFESAKPSQNRIILFESRKGNSAPLLTVQTPLVDITETDYCIGKGTYAQGGDNVRPQTGFMGIISSVIKTPNDTQFVRRDGLYSVKRVTTPALGTVGNAQAAQMAAKLASEAREKETARRKTAAAADGTDTGAVRPGAVMEGSDNSNLVDDGEGGGALNSGDSQSRVGHEEDEASAPVPPPPVQGGGQKSDGTFASPAPSTSSGGTFATALTSGEEGGENDDEVSSIPPQRVDEMNVDDDEEVPLGNWTGGGGSGFGSKKRDRDIDIVENAARNTKRRARANLQD